jgi:predicted TIM-barrel fold metal-dependent hydrolase
MGIDDALVRRISTLGWHAQIHVAGDQIRELADHLLELRCKIVIDHMARIPAKWGIGSEAFQCLLKLVDGGNVWVKLSAPMRYSSEDSPPYSDVALMAQTLMRHAPERVLWASDWPNVNYAGVIPSYAKLLDLLYDWAPDEHCRKRILVDNPAELYAFGPALSAASR